MGRRLLPLLLALALTVSASASGGLSGTAGYVYDTVPNPALGSVGGEWAVIGLARSGYGVGKDYNRAYHARVEQTVRNKKGVLSARKYTEYTRVILALTATGKDARSVGGYDLTLPLGDYERTVLQGINGAVFALLALDSARYPMPLSADAKIQATRQMYIGTLLDAQTPDGGWSLSGRSAEADITAMALQALAKYRAQIRVDQAVKKGIVCLSGLQNADGSFSSDSKPTAESCAQVILALCELGLSADDPRFVKNGKSVLDAMEAFRTRTGGYRHISAGAVDPMASEQALLALASIDRVGNGQKSLYRMDDVLSPGAVGVTFTDLRGSKDRSAVEALAVRGVVNGKGDGRYDPKGTLTRAEFAAIVTRAAGLVPESGPAFSDVGREQWFAPYVGAVSGAGITKGVGGGRFAPDAAITRQEAAVMLARAAERCGLDAAGGTDAPTAAAWAREGVSFCVTNGIISKNDLRLTQNVTRGEMAAMVEALMRLASLA